MTLSYFIELADYNIWANREAIQWLENITPAQWSQPIVSSFGSIEATVIHLAGAEKLWRERLVNIHPATLLPGDLNISKTELLDLWRTASVQLKDAVLQLVPNQMQSIMAFKRLNGEPVEMEYYHALAHIFNHSTYHRGQLLTLLKQAGHQDISSTDMLVYFRKK